MRRRVRRLERAAVALVLSLGAACRCGEKAAAGPWSIAKVDPATRRVTTSGDVVGGEGRYGSHAWLGIPFAAPPVGELRWRAPRPPAPWQGTREAISFAQPCAQFASAMFSSELQPGSVYGSEDCLYLNVWTPRFAEGKVPQGDARLPVMLWIHGGGNSIGGASFYDGGNLAAAQSVVVVSIQYRMGPLGWFRHPALFEGATDDDRSGNFGTLDQIRALEWVRDNISAFGGHPGNVTIFGESAGGFDVYALLLSPRARGLFHRAIAQSAGLTWFSTDEAERYADETPAGHKNSSAEMAARMLQGAGLAKDRAEAKAKAAAMAGPALAQFLRARSLDEVMLLTGNPGRIAMISMPLLIADGAVLPKEPPLSLLARADGWNRVPVIAGTNRDELKLFLFLDPKRVYRKLGFLPRLIDEPTYLATAQHVSRMWKATGADEPAAAMRASGAQDVYVYRFDWDEEPEPYWTELPKMLGAAHALELPFVFGHFEMGALTKFLWRKERLPARDRLSAAMMGYWAQFARSGSPGRGPKGDAPEWLPWEAGGRFMVFDTDEDGGVRVERGEATRAEVLAAIDADPRLAAPEERCRLLRNLMGPIGGMAKQRYADRCPEPPSGATSAAR